MVRHAEEKHDFKIPRTSTDEKRLASWNSILSAPIIFFINCFTTNSLFAAHLGLPLKTISSTMLKNSWHFKSVQPEPGFSQPNFSLIWQSFIISQRMDASFTTCFLLFSKTVLTDREKKQPVPRQTALPFKHQRHRNRDYKTSCHGESYITAGKLPGRFLVWFTASHASLCPEVNNRSGSTLLLGGGD